MEYVFRYRNLVKRLIVCHDQMVQTQKRNLIKRVLDCAVGRMLEYKQEIVNLNYSDHQFSNFSLEFYRIYIENEKYVLILLKLLKFRWPDDFMKQLKYTPDDVEILVSAAGKDVVKERRQRIQKMIEDAVTSYEITYKLI